MEQSNLRKLAAMAQTPEAVERSVTYMTEQLSRFLKKNERVLILYPKNENAGCQILERALLSCGCIPVWMGEDGRWMTLLKTAFTTKCSCMIGPPLTLLGLSKLAKQMGTPLYVKNVLMAGYPTTTWLVDGVRRGLDCMAWGCFDPGEGAVISGFTCERIDGVHIRTDEYTVEIVDDEGKVLPDGMEGHVVLYPNADPTIRFAVGDKGRLDTSRCSCGCNSPKLVDIDVIKFDNEEMSDLGESLHYWSSVLDCRVQRTPYGMELEMIVFPGEKLPQLPTVAKQIIKPFDPETDAPFSHGTELKKRIFAVNPH